MNFIAPIRIWRIRLELRRRVPHDQPYSIHLERRRPVRFGNTVTREYWQYVNYIRVPVRPLVWGETRIVKLIIGCEATMRDSQGHPRLNEVLEMAQDQAAGVLTRSAIEEG